MTLGEIMQIARDCELPEDTELIIGRIDYECDSCGWEGETTSVTIANAEEMCLSGRFGKYVSIHANNITGKDKTVIVLYPGS